MSLKKFGDNECGLTYTIEAILGVSLILGTVIFATGNLPYVAQKTGEHSKVQLMNIGRDTLDLTVAAPVYETCPNCLSGIVGRTYLLVADKTFVMINETSSYCDVCTVNFTVYNLDGTMVIKPLTLYQTILGRSVSTPMKNITGNASYSWSTSTAINASEFLIQASDSSGFSNYVTIKIGYYYLDTDTNGIFIGANDTNISGVIYNSSGFGIPNLDITILDSTYTLQTPLNPPPNKTMNGKTIETFDDYTGWQTNGQTGSNDTYKEGNASMSVNSTSDSFWIETALTQRLTKFDILSFYFYANTGNELVKVELLNGTLSIFNRTAKASVPGWNKINTLLNSSNTSDMDTVKIHVWNINKGFDYLFDNMTVGDGKFEFKWPTQMDNKNTQSGLYYIQATDSIHSSNMHLITYSDKGSGGNILWQDTTIYETQWVDLFETDSDGNVAAIQNTNNFFINSTRYGLTTCSPQINATFSIFYPVCGDKTKIRFTSNVAGDYYIWEQTCGGECGNNAIKTNGITIHVLPLTNSGPTGNTCVDKIELNKYMRRYVPPNVNYNLYLIGPDGKRFTQCTKFQDGQLINGYPTDKAVAVNKLLYIKYVPTNIDNILELRMVLWYK